MFITCAKLTNGNRLFIVMNYDTGELYLIELSTPRGYFSYLQHYRELGYTFIPYAEF